MKKIVITGGAGFIGSHVVRLFVNKYPDYQIYNLDCLTYAGNLENLKDVEDKPNYHFIKGDISDGDFVQNLFQKHQFDGGRVTRGPLDYQSDAVCADKRGGNGKFAECCARYLEWQF